MTSDELKRGSLTINGHCAVWSDREDSGWCCELHDLPRDDQIAILMHWLEDYCKAHDAFIERQRLQHGGKVAFLDEERAKGRRGGKHGF